MRGPTPCGVEQLAWTAIDCPAFSVLLSEQYSGHELDTCWCRRVAGPGSTTYAIAHVTPQCFLRCRLAAKCHRPSAHTADTADRLMHVHMHTHGCCCRLYEVEGIPTLVVVDEQLKTITSEGTGAVAADPACAKFPWRPQPLERLSDFNVRAINAGKALLLVLDNEDEVRACSAVHFRYLYH